MNKHNWNYEAVTCPVCHAQPGAPCLDLASHKPVLYFHAGRVDEAQRKRNVN